MIIDHRVYKHKHAWYKRTKYDRAGFYIMGYVCECGKKDYVDLIRGLPGEDKDAEGLEGKSG